MSIGAINHSLILFFMPFALSYFRPIKIERLPFRWYLAITIRLIDCHENRVIITFLDNSIDPTMDSMFVVLRVCQNITLIADDFLGIFVVGCKSIIFVK